MDFRCSTRVAASNGAPDIEWFREPARQGGIPYIQSFHQSRWFSARFQGVWNQAQLPGRYPTFQWKPSSSNTMMSQGKDMNEARMRTTVDVDVIKHLLWNGQAEWKRHSQLVQVISRDPVLDRSRKPYESRSEQYLHGLAITKRLFELQDIHGWSDQDLRAAFVVTGEHTSIGLHHQAFLPVIMAQGSSEQVKTYGALGATYAILGSYAQTELAHGTQVSNLETTATYIPESREFELHSPRLESSKWWIGGLAKFSTHCVVQARLILPEGDKGVHLFLLQIRSLDDHKTLPGITLGDIGPKAFGAYGAVDNGWMRLDHVRIPLSAMLSKFANVTEEGTYKVPVHSKLSYGGMIYIRAGMITPGGWILAKAATIAIRYATVRRQGNGPPGQEKQIITYPSVHHRLLPILSRAYALIFLGREMLKLYNEMSSQLSNQSTALLAETHAVSSGLKILVASSVADDLETARRSMGGHGYSAVSGIGTLWANWVPANTYEGDNYVLAQQVVRSALKSLRSLASSPDPVKAAEALPPSTFFLRLLYSPPRAKEPQSFGTTDFAIYLLELRGAYMIQEYASRIESGVADGGADWRVAKAVTDAFVARRIGEVITRAQMSLSGSTARAFSSLLRLFLLCNIEAGLVDLLSFGLFPQHASGDNYKDPTRSLRAEIAQLETELLPEAIGLTDAFGFTDFELDSALGVKDGKAYEALWKRTRLEPLNVADVHEGYEGYIKPILERGRKLLENPKSKL